MEIKSAALTVLVTLTAIPSLGQYWSTASNNIWNTNSSNVGIGTSGNSYINSKLTVRGNVEIQNSSGTKLIYFPASGNSYFNNGGNVGIGTTNPDARFVVRGGESQFAYYSYFASNVGIGTTNPSSALCVNGTIRAREVVVTTQGWPDHVLKPDYNLKPLHEVEKYIKKNSHLEGIPSEKEIKVKGIPMGEMQAKLLQKLEETTLYLIEMKKENEQLKARLAAIEQKVK
jgi:hypothetical protein